MGELNYTPCHEPKVPPCLMEDEYGQVFFVTEAEGEEGYYFTCISQGNDEITTFKKQLKNHKPLPKGTKFEFIN